MLKRWPTEWSKHDTISVEVNSMQCLRIGHALRILEYFPSAKACRCAPLPVCKRAPKGEQRIVTLWPVRHVVKGDYGVFRISPKIPYFKNILLLTTDKIICRNLFCFNFIPDIPINVVVRLLRGHCTFVLVVLASLRRRRMTEVSSL
jgi:hypothetical protein